MYFCQTFEKKIEYSISSLHLCTLCVTHSNSQSCPVNTDLKVVFFYNIFNKILNHPDSGLHYVLAKDRDSVQMTIETDDDLIGLKAAGKAVATVLKKMMAYAEPGMSTFELDQYGGGLLEEFGAISAPLLT